MHRREAQPGKTMSLTVLTWNVEWATPGSWRTTEILRCIDDFAPEVVCLTESGNTLLDGSGFTISAAEDYGYPIKPGRRKVLLWSRQPWTQVEDLSAEPWTIGRYISGVTQTSLGEVRVIGACIPWWGCRTEARRGPDRRARWQDHKEYIAGLTELLRGIDARRLVVMGDFNQVIGQGARAPVPLRTALHAAFHPRIPIATADVVFEGRKSIDHIALSPDLRPESLDVIGNYRDGRRLSDHFGVVASVTTVTRPHARMTPPCQP